MPGSGCAPTTALLVPTVASAFSSAFASALGSACASAFASAFAGRRGFLASASGVPFDSDFGAERRFRGDAPLPRDGCSAVAGLPFRSPTFSGAAEATDPAGAGFGFGVAIVATRGVTTLGMLTGAGSVVGLSAGGNPPDAAQAGGAPSGAAAKGAGVGVAVGAVRAGDVSEARIGRGGTGLGETGCGAGECAAADDLATGAAGSENGGGEVAARGAAGCIDVDGGRATDDAIEPAATGDPAAA